MSVILAVPYQRLRSPHCASSSDDSDVDLLAEAVFVLFNSLTSYVPRIESHNKSCGLEAGFRL